jgi:hypothetical protein
MKRILFVVPLLFFICACGKDYSVPLSYPVIAAQGDTCDARLAVAEFQDKRGRNEIGDDGKFPYYPEMRTPGQWVSDAVISELKARGCTIEVAAPGTPFASPLIVRGDVLNIYLKKNSAIDYELTMKIDVQVENQGRRIWNKQREGAWQKTFVNPVGSKEEEFLRTSLQDLLSGILPEIEAVAEGAEALEKDDFKLGE